MDRSIFGWYKKVVFENYANFSGRARRKEYWSFQLINVLIILLLYIPFIVFAVGSIDRFDPTNIFGNLSFYTPMIPVMIYSLAVFIPSMAASVRRLHDAGYTGWLMLMFFILNFIPFISFISGIASLVFHLLDSQPGYNKWGPNPKMSPQDELDQIGVE